MSETKWTPAPWFLINDCCVGGPIEPGWEEAGCGIAHCGMRARTPEEAAANARQNDALAAAVATIERDRFIWSGLPQRVKEDWEVMLSEMKAALLKARGDQP